MVERLVFAILCHWRSGSSVLTKLLHACGMHLGNEATGWDDAWMVGPCEHNVFNSAGNGLYNFNDDSGLPAVIKTLLAYRTEAQRNDWDAYGVKFTHALQDKCFARMHPLFVKFWPDAHYVISVRHPAGIVASLKGTEITTDKIVESWMSAVPATKDLAKAGATIVVYPDMLTVPKARKVVSKLGLTWTAAASKLMEDSAGKIKGSVLSSLTMAMFDRNYPEAGKAFKELVKLS